MALSVGIKNSILVLLIILIIHVILKNMKSTENYNNCNPIPIKEKPAAIKQEYEENQIAAFDDFDINYEYYLQAEKAAEATDSENKTCNLNV